MKILVTTLALSLFFCISCNSKTEKHKTHQDKDHKEWSYKGETGPEHWPEMENCEACKGLSQSPINIIEYEVKEEVPKDILQLEYDETTLIKGVTNNGHTVQFDFEAKNYLYYQDTKYKLKQIHFHEAAEHTLNGIRYPLEIHLVHLSKKGDIAVIGLFVQEGKNSLPFERLEKHLPIAKGETKQINNNFDMNKLLPYDKTYFTYEGSLTTPPCTEGVRWIVMKKPITAAENQLKQLSGLMPLNNFRNEQALNGRIVKKGVIVEMK